MFDWLWHLPPRIRIAVQDINPATGSQRIDPETGERLWTHAEVNAPMYAVGAAYVVLYMLVYLLWDELRAALSPAYRLERDRRWVEIVERKMKQRELYKQKKDV